nr:hypothetical protein [Tanacetum cinerariifolium]
MGLDDVFGSVRSTILTSDPIPDVKSAFATLSRDESYRNSNATSKSSKSRSTTFAARSGNNNWVSNRSNNNNTGSFTSNNNWASNKITNNASSSNSSSNQRFKKIINNQKNSNHVSNSHINTDQAKSVPHTLTSDQYQRLMVWLSATGDTSKGFASVASTIMFSNHVISFVSDAGLANSQRVLQYPRLRKEKEEDQQRKFLENLKQLHINKPFIKASAQMPKYAKFMKSLLTNKARLEEACIVTINKRCLAVLLNKLRSKEKYPGSLTIPCDIGHLHINNALADLGASISLMAYTMYENLGNKSGENSDIRMRIRRIESINTPYSEAHKTTGTDEVNSEHLYSASANEIDEKKPELKDLPHHFEYAYLHGSKSFLIIISSKLSEKEKMLLLQVLEKRKGGIAWKMRMPFGLCNAPTNFQRCMMAIFHDMVEDFMEVFMDDFLVFGNSFNCCLANLDKFLLEEEIADKFPDQHLMTLIANLNDDEPWYADYVNYIVGKIVPPKWILERIRSKIFEILAHCHSGPTGGHHSASITRKKRSGNISSRSEMPQNNIQERTKKWHDSRLQWDKDFIVGDKVALFNSRLRMHTENMISNEYAVNLCLEHEVKRGNKVVKKELIVALRGEIYFVKFIINPEEDDVEPGVGVTTLITKFLILDIPIDRDAPIVVGRGFLYTIESDSDDKEEYEIKRNKFGAPMYGPKPVPYLNCNDPAERSEIDEMLRIKLREAGSNKEIFTSVARIRAFNINEPIYSELCHRFYSTYEFDEVCADDELQTKKIIKFRLGRRAHSFTLLEFAQRLGLYHVDELDEEGFDVYFQRDLWLLSMFDARHQNGYANVAWLIARWMKRKGAGTQRESQICCGQFITKISMKTVVLTDDVIRSMSTLIYCRDLDTTTLRELIDYEGRLIPEDPQPDVPRDGIPRPLRASLKDLYDRMGSMKIRQEAIERMEYR